VGVAGFPVAIIWNFMSRANTAILIGILGFAAYVVAVLILAEFVIGTHWAVEFVFFAVTGIVWVWPAKWLMFWGAR